MPEIDMCKDCNYNNYGWCKFHNTYISAARLNCSTDIRFGKIFAEQPITYVEPSSKTEKPLIEEDHTLLFTQCRTNLAGYMYRTWVPGGWLVKSVDDVLVKTPMNPEMGDSGYQWQNSICFIPDPKHEWKITEVE